MADEQIVFEYIVKLGDALQKIADIDNATAKAKQQLQDLANVTKKSYSDLAKELATIAREQKESLKQTGPKDMWDAGKLKEYEAASKQLPIILKGIANATKELINEQKLEETQLKQIDTAQRVLDKQLVSETQQAMSNQRQQIKDRIALEKELQGRIRERVQVEAQSSVYESKLSQGRSPQQAINALAVYNAELQKGVKMSTAYAIAQQKVTKDLVGVDKELRQKPKDVGGFQAALQKLGTVGQFVFGTILGITAIGVFNALRTGFTNLVEDGQKFLQTMYRFETSVQNLQRRGLNITLKDATEQVKSLREEFGVFSQQEAMAAVANVQLLTANFGFSTKQMYKMTEAAAALAIITGEDLDEASRKLALFLSSGYSEGLQRAGLAINKLSVSQRAFEQGLIDTKFAYAQLTEKQRAQVAEEVIEEQTRTLLVSAMQQQQTELGKLKKATADLKTETDNLALATTPLKKAWTDFELSVLKAFQGYRATILKFDNLAAGAAAVWVAAFTVIKEAFRQLVQDHTIDTDKLFQLYHETFERIKSDMMATYKTGLALDVDPFAAMSNIPADDQAKAAAEARAAQANADAEALQAQYDQNLDVVKEFYDIKQQFIEKDAELNQEYIDEVGYVTKDGLSNILGEFSDFYNNKTDMSVEDFKAFVAQQESLYGEIGTITEDGLVKLWELWRKYTDKIGDINEKLAEDIAKEDRKYQQDLEDVERETQQKLEDAARKYRYDQLRAERDFQEKMRRLREEFLFDLEDALRERDALAVLRLIRRYRLDVGQAQRQYELERQERLEAYRREIEDIKRQAEQKRQELKIEHDQKLADLREEAQEERDQAEIDRKLAYDELMADLDKEREDAKIKRDLALEDLKTWLGDQLTELLVKYSQMKGVTEEMVTAMAGLFADYMGKNGVIDLTLDNFQSILDGVMKDVKKKVEELRQLALEVSELTDYINENDPNKENTPSEENAGEPIYGHASGGHASYGRYMLGERGEEFVIKADVLKTLEHNLGRLTQSKLLSLLNQSPNVNVTAVDGGKGSRDTEHTVNVQLSEGLVGEIVDAAMNETSKVYLTATRERR